VQHEQRGIRATFPVNDRTVAVLFTSPEAAGEAMRKGLRLASGRSAEVRRLREGSPGEVLLDVDAPPEPGVVVDQVVVEGIGEDVGPRFVHGIRTPMELKAPYIEPRFPFGSTLVGVHVSVACCTGCNGGVHDRGLVVITDHVGGSWSGIWVQTVSPMPEDYARWQKVEFLGGVLREEYGSTTVADEGWMRVRLGEEDRHAPPRPVRVTAGDFPSGGTRTLLARSLDACWVEFVDVVVVQALKVEAPGSDKDGSVRLPRMEVLFSDSYDRGFIAWLYQPSAFNLSPGDRLASLRGFVHAEAPGRYVLLGDKEEDLFRQVGVVDLTSEEEIRRLLDDRPERTQTYRVPPNLVGRIPLDTRVKLRSMDDAETRELADYLGIAVEDLDRPLRVVDAGCPHCERRITFLDFVQTAVQTGQHERAQLREILTGRAGAWITIRGRDGGRPVVCAHCGQIARMPNGYSEYSSGSYAYA
jgi:hypothetical protein